MSPLAVCAVLVATGVWLGGREAPRRPFGRGPGGTRAERAASRSGPTLPEVLVAELLAAALEAGAAPETATLQLSRALAAVGDRRAGGLRRLAVGGGASHPEGDRLLVELAAGLELAARTGVAPAEFARRAGHRAQSRAAERAQVAIARLPVLLVLPAGLCLLPAAFLIGIVPVVLDLARSVLGGTP